MPFKVSRGMVRYAPYSNLPHKLFYHAKPYEKPITNETYGHW